MSHQNSIGTMERWPFYPKETDDCTTPIGVYQCFQTIEVAQFKDCNTNPLSCCIRGSPVAVFSGALSAFCREHYSIESMMGPIHKTFPPFGGTNP